MKPALLPRYARVCLAVLALGAAAACTKREGQPPSAPAAVAPFGTMPAPIEIPASAAPAYMADHVAKDAALTQALAGSWTERTAVEGRPADMAMTFKADGGFWTVTTVAGAADVVTASGTWQIARGFLTYAFGGKQAGRVGSAEILRLDANQFVYVDGEDKLTRIATRQAGPIAVAAATPSATVAPPAAAPAADGTLFVDETLFVAKDDVQVQVLRLGDAAQIRLVLELEEKVPITVVFQRGRLSPEEYAMGLGMLMLCQVFSGLEENKGKKDCPELFDSRLSKRAAYGGFASPWVTLAAGTYTVILDNSGELSPSRGDAPARLRAYKRPVP